MEDLREEEVLTEEEVEIEEEAEMAEEAEVVNHKSQHQYSMLMKTRQEVIPINSNLVNTVLIAET